MAVVAPTQLNVVDALPKYPPLKRAVLGYAIQYAGAPYVWGGTSDQPQTLFGLPAAGGFDCSGFVWWVMKERSYTVPGTTWSGDRQDPVAVDLRHGRAHPDGQPDHVRATSSRATSCSGAATPTGC